MDDTEPHLWLPMAFITLHLYRAVPIYISVEGSGDQETLLFDRWRARVFDESGNAKRIAIRVLSRIKRRKW